MNRVSNHKHSGALRFILLLGLVSLCADVVYEGARSITGPFLFTLGASAVAVGWIAGLGEFLGYGLRLLTGFLADRLRTYWLFTFLGYALSVLAIPLLALAGRWEIAAGLIILERMGKAMRTPARDVMLSSTTKQVGRGWGFGLHEALDQIGAIAGPLFIALSLYLKNSFQVSFAWLLIPAIFTLGFLTLARLRFPAPLALELPSQRQTDSARQRLPRIFWLYTIFTGFNMAGFAHFQLIAFHFKSQSIITDAMIPVFSPWQWAQML